MNTLQHPDVRGCTRGRKEPHFFDWKLPRLVQQLTTDTEFRLLSSTQRRWARKRLHLMEEEVEEEEEGAKKTKKKKKKKKGKTGNEEIMLRYVHEFEIEGEEEKGKEEDQGEEQREDEREEEEGKKKEEETVAGTLSVAVGEATPAYLLNDHALAQMAAGFKSLLLCRRKSEWHSAPSHMLPGALAQA